MILSDFLRLNSTRKARIFSGFPVILLLLNLFVPVVSDISDESDLKALNENDFDIEEYLSDYSATSRGSRTGASVGPDNWLSFKGAPSHHGNSTSLAPLDNSVLWEYEAKGPVESSPTVSNGRVYFGDNDWNVNCLDIDTGGEKWSFHTSKYSPVPKGGDWVRTALAIHDGKIVFGCDDYYVYAIEEEDGDKLWHFSAFGPVKASPTISNGIVFATSLSAQTDANGTLYAIDEDTGDYIIKFLDNRFPKQVNAMRVRHQVITAIHHAFEGRQHGQVVLLDLMEEFRIVRLGLGRVRFLAEPIPRDNPVIE